MAGKRGRRRKAKGKVAKAVKEYVERKIDAGIEDKFLYDQFVVAAGAGPTNSGVLYPLNGIAQGNGPNQRIGFRIKDKLLAWKVRFNPATSQNADTMVRMVIVKDMMAYAAAPILPDDILGLVGAISTPSNPLKPLSQNNFYHNNKRFTLLYDKLFQLDMDQIVNNTGGNYHFITNQTYQKAEHIHKLSGYTNYIGDTGSLASYGKGVIYVIWFSNVTSVTDSPGIDFQSVYTYEDA